MSIEQEAVEIFGGTFEEDNKALLEANERREHMLEFMKDYKPSKVTDGYAVIKGQSDANFNFIRVEDYEGDKPEYLGHKFLKYELQICDGQENEGRRLWKSVDMEDEAKVKKFADMLWTITGLDFKDEASLHSALENLANRTVAVKYWGFTTEKEKQLAKDEGREPDKIQTHMVKALAKKEGTAKKSEVPF